MGFTRYKVLWPTAINVLSIKREPGEEFVVDNAGVKENKRELTALLKNKYIEEIKG